VISRHWRGVSKRERAEAYIAHLQAETFPLLMRIPGFVRASILKREVDRGTDMMVEFDERVRHYEVVHGTEGSA
jgi:hypothetical protein